MPNAVGVQPGTHLLGDHVDVVILEILGDARDESNAHREAEKERHAPDKLADRVFMESRGVGIDDMPEDQWIEKREDLIDRSEHERRGYQLPIILQVPVKSRHLPT